MRKNFLWSFLLIIAFFAAGFFLVGNHSENLKPENIKYVKIAGEDIKVALALTNQVRAQGLSGKSGLEENEGMLFVFEHPGKYPFWMKDMNFPIDMIWLGEDMKVAYIKKDARPESYPEIYEPDQNAKYVLEVNAGFSDKYGLKEGDSVEFTQ